MPGYEDVARYCGQCHSFKPGGESIERRYFGQGNMEYWLSSCIKVLVGELCRRHRAREHSTIWILMESFQEGGMLQDSHKAGRAFESMWLQMRILSKLAICNQISGPAGVDHPCGLQGLRVRRILLVEWQLQGDGRTSFRVTVRGFHHGGKTVVYGNLSLQPYTYVLLPIQSLLRIALDVSLMRSSQSYILKHRSIGPLQSSNIRSLHLVSEVWFPPSPSQPRCVSLDYSEPMLPSASPDPPLCRRQLLPFLFVSVVLKANNGPLVKIDIANLVR